MATRSHRGKTYHHAALLRSARTLLEEEGIVALGLRAITRHAGVSPTAAVPHFGNLTGLLSALATVGYEELGDALTPVVEQGAHAVGVAYVRFAMLNPGLFTLMFRSDMLDRQDPAFAAASARTSAILTQLVEDAGPAQSGRSHAAIRAALWAKVHGLAVLAVDGFLEILLANEKEKLSLEELIKDALR